MAPAGPVDEAETITTTARFDDFFAANHETMVRALALALGDAELGRDAAAEGFTRALARWDRISQYANPLGWVYRVGLNWGRSRWRRQRREVTGGWVEARADDRTAVTNEPDIELVAALRRLSHDHRAVVVGRYYLDWSESQLAAALDVAPGTVKSRLHRALAALAETLEGDAGTSREHTTRAEAPDDAAGRS